MSDGISPGEVVVEQSATALTRLPSGGRSEHGDGFDWLAAFGTVLVSRRTIVVGLLLGAIMAAALVALSPKQYVTELSFTPLKNVAGSGGLSALAGQFGIDVAGSDAGASPEFYSRLLSTRVLSERIVRREYTISSDGTPRKASFMDLYDIQADTPGERLIEGMRVLQDDVLRTSIDRQTSVVTVEIRTRWPELSYAIGQHVLAELDEFNLSSRRRQAAAEQQFLEQRLDTLRIELRSAERALESFLLKNRSFRNDPSLVFEYERLEREVVMRSGVYSVLLQSHEQARVAAVRNTPSLTVVQPPEPPLHHDRPSFIAMTVVGGTVGALLGLFVILVRSIIQGLKRAKPTEYEYALSAWRDTVADARRVIPVSKRRG